MISNFHWRPFLFNFSIVISHWAQSVHNQWQVQRLWTTLPQIQIIHNSRMILQNGNYSIHSSWNKWVISLVKCYCKMRYNDISCELASTSNIAIWHSIQIEISWIYIEWCFSVSDSGWHAKLANRYIFHSVQWVNLNLKSFSYQIRLQNSPKTLDCILMVNFDKW